MRHMKLVRWSALRTGRLYPQGDIAGTQFCRSLNRPDGNSEAGKIKTMKNPNDRIGNQTRDLPARSEAPQPTAQPRDRKRYLYVEQTLVLCSCPSIN